MWTSCALQNKNRTFKTPDVPYLIIWYEINFLKHKWSWRRFFPLRYASSVLTKRYSSSVLTKRYASSVLTKRYAYVLTLLLYLQKDILLLYLQKDILLLYLQKDMLLLYLQFLNFNLLQSVQEYVCLEEILQTEERGVAGLWWGNEEHSARDGENHQSVWQ